MNLRVFPWVAAGALVLARPDSSAGQSRLWDSYCTAGAFQACMSVELSLVIVPVPLTESTNGWVTQISVAIRNLQGTLGSATAWGLTALRITGLTTSRTYLPDFPGGTGQWDVLNVAPTLEGGAGSVGNPSGGYWIARPEGQFPAFISREAQRGDGALPIAGCAPLVPDANGLYSGEPAYLQTCGESRVVYSFTGPPLEFTDATTVSIRGATSDRQTVECTFDTDCQSVVPEPATLVLLGTGLVGLGGLRLRRARGARLG